MVVLLWCSSRLEYHRDDQDSVMVSYWHSFFADYVFERGRIEFMIKSLICLRIQVECIHAVVISLEGSHSMVGVVVIHKLVLATYEIDIMTKTRIKHSL